MLWGCSLHVLRLKMELIIKLFFVLVFTGLLVSLVTGVSSFLCSFECFFFVRARLYFFNFFYLYPISTLVIS